MYRKQVRRRRAVLALLIVGSFALLTITYGQGSDGVQRGVTAVFAPVSSVLDRASEARPRPDQLGRRNLRRARQEPQLEDELEVARKEAVGAQVALAENEELRSLLKLDSRARSRPATKR